MLRPAADYGLTYLGDEPEPLLGALYGDLMTGGFRWNDPALHEGEIPAANAIGTARSIARLYACLAQGGELDGARLLSDDTVRLGATELARDLCAVTRRSYAFGVGFELNTELGILGPPAGRVRAHGLWRVDARRVAEERVGFSFAMNGLRPEAPTTAGAGCSAPFTPRSASHYSRRSRSSVVQKSSPVPMYRREPAGWSQARHPAGRERLRDEPAAGLARPHPLVDRRQAPARGRSRTERRDLVAGGSGVRSPGSASIS